MIIASRNGSIMNQHREVASMERIQRLIGMRSRLLAVVALAALLGGAPEARAILINFDADGTNGGVGVQQVGNFTFNPGNALSQGGVTAINAFIATATATTATDGTVTYTPNANTTQTATPLYYQAILAVPQTSTAAANNGEITVVARVNEIVTQVVTPPSGNNAVTFSLDTPQTTSFLRMFYATPAQTTNPALDLNRYATDLAGTNFGDAALRQIYNGTFVRQGGSAGVIGTFTLQNGGALTPFDQSPEGVNNYPGVLSVTGSGSSNNLQVTTISTDNTFFQSATPGLVFNTNNITPFRDTNPSLRFFDGASASIIPAIGTSNGRNGADFQFEALASAAIVPEPSSILMLGLGGLAVGALRLRRRASVA